MPTASLGSSGTHAWPHSTYSMDEELSTSFVLALDLRASRRSSLVAPVSSVTWSTSGTS